MAKETKINYTENDRAIVNALRDAEGPMTLAQLREVTGLNLVAGHIVSAMKKELIVKAGEVEVEKPATRKVSTYNYVDSDVRSNDSGKPYNYTDGEKEILAAASKMENSFTLAQLSEVMGRKISSGSTNGLIKKGNLTKGDQVTVATVAKSIVGVFAFNKDIPTE